MVPTTPSLLQHRKTLSLSSASEAATAASTRSVSHEKQKGNIVDGKMDNEEYHSLTPWLRQLWSGGAKETSGNVDPSTIGKALNLKSPVGNFPAIDRKQHHGEYAEDDDCDDDGDGSGKVKEDPKQGWPMDPYLYPHLRSCLSDVKFESHDLATRDTGLSVCMLGTGAGSASKLRSNTCTVIKNGSYSYLIDAGEGVQRQFLASRLNFRDVRKIFITHMHGDHVFGLPGLLLNLQVSGLLARKERSVEIFGPVGLHNFIATSLSFTGTELRNLSVEVYELQGGTQRSMRYSGNRKNFSEFNHRVRHM